jgi:fumarylacetoacetate (FAA) hydrolase family protein
MAPTNYLTARDYAPVGVLPDDGRVGSFVGRVWVPAALARNGIAGPRVVCVREGRVVDVSERFRTFRDLIDAPDPVAAVRACRGADLGAWTTIVSDSLFFNRAASLAAETHIVLLAPNDLLAIKACGVTFIRSLLERVVEEKAKGDPVAAAGVRTMILDTLGPDLSAVRPGSPATIELKQKLIAAGLWSQYLEVGIGPNPEVFTKAQPMSAVGYGAEVGVLPDSTWNNPEPEIVLAVSARGEIRGAALGNDVNLRDYEGRSALLLGEAKDQNASCAIGPMVRLFDETFTIADVERCDVELSVHGNDGFHTSGQNSIAQISRSPRSLVEHACGHHHQYPDGFMLFLGTMFAPTEDRGTPGAGFTHHVGDRVEIAVPSLGRLVNWVNHTDRIPRWEYGTGALIEFLLACQRRPEVAR